MAKRIRVLAWVLILSMVSLGGRIFYIIYYNADTAAVLANSHTEYYGSNRGLIFDKNMNRLVEINKQKIHPAYNPSFTFEVPERYAEHQLCAHIIGYTDADNNGVCGIEKDYNAYLKAIPNQIKIKTYKDARGKTLAGKGTVADTSKSCNDSGIMLTIDKTIQSAVETAGKRLSTGAVVVMNSYSGEIVALASFPSFEPNNISVALNSEKKQLINRALCNYNVGSVFKVLVCIAALESGVLPSFSYTCKGKSVCGQTTFHCHKRDGHGTINMKQALAFSCNTYFIALAQKIGYQKLLSISKRVGFEQPITLSRSIKAVAGNLPHSRDLSSPAALANFSFGQGELLSTPLRLCSIYAAIDNGGKLPEPHLIKGEVLNGVCSYQKSSSKKVFEKKDAHAVKEFLSYSVSKGTGKNAAVENCAVAGKTATAQTGKYEGNTEKLISYFIGFCTIKKDSYTIAVMRENGISGSEDCAPVFKEICERMAQLKE